MPGPEPLRLCRRYPGSHHGAGDPAHGYSVPPVLDDGSLVLQHLGEVAPEATSGYCPATFGSGCTPQLAVNVGHESYDLRGGQAGFGRGPQLLQSGSASLVEIEDQDVCSLELRAEAH